MYLADGGFIKRADITAAETAGIEVDLPIREIDEQRAKGIDPFAPRPYSGHEMPHAGGDGIVGRDRDARRQAGDDIDAGRDCDGLS